MISALLRRATAVAVILCAVLAVPAAHAQNAVAIDIPAQPLNAALLALGKQTGLQLSFPPEDVAGKQAPAVSGTLTPQQALEQLLAGSGLSYRSGPGNSIVIERAMSPASQQQLSEVKVVAEGDQGYVATHDSSGTKTDTPLIETPQSISVVTRDRLDEQGVNYLNEALRYVPGVQGEPFGYETRLTYIQLRGFDAYTDSLYMDGLKLTNPGFLVSYNLEPYGAERLEIPRGPASVLYGQGSPGGLINYASKKPSKDAVHEFAFEPGNYSRYQGKFDIGGALDQAGTVTYRVVGLGRDSDTQIDYVQDNRQFLAPSFAWRPNADTSLVVLSHFQHDRTRDSQAVPGEGTLTPNPNGHIPSNRFTGEPNVDRYERTEAAIGYEFEHRANDTWTFRQNLRYLNTKVDEVVVYVTGLEADQRTMSRAFFQGFGTLGETAVDTQAQAKFATGSAQHTLLIGLDYQRSDADAVRYADAAPGLDAFAPVYGAPITFGAPYQDDDTVADQIGLYLQDQIKFDKHWILTLGGRNDWASSSTFSNLTQTTSDQSDRKFTGRAGLVYVSDIGLAPYISYSQSFLPMIGLDPSGNPFSPETGEQYEAGVKYQPAGSESFLTVSAFHITRQNTTQFDPSTFLTVQTGEVRSRGIELEGNARFDSGFNLTGSYTYLDPEITKSVIPAEIGSRPTWVPRQMASLWGNYTQHGGPFDGWGAGLGVRYQGATYGDTPNTLRVPGTTLADAEIHYNWNNFQFAINARNLFDKEYVTSCYFRSSVVCTYGERRTVIGRIAYRW